MRTQLCLENTETVSYRARRKPSVALGDDGLRASHTTAVARKREPSLDAKLEKVERQLRESMLAHLGDLYAYARFLLLHPTDAEDAVHECYLKALLYIGDYKAATAKVWLTKLLRMVCFRELLQRGDCIFGDADDRKTSLPLACTTDQTAVEPPKLPSEHPDTTVQRLVSSLPLALREAIILHECLSFSYSEMAVVTGTSASVANERLSRARRMLLGRGALAQRSDIGAEPAGCIRMQGTLMSARTDGKS
jgi:RNA polymerase sigma-70 factor (ECF subfamily)